MRLPWIATCFLLGLILVLDPTQTPAQYGRKGDGGDKGEFGGKRGEFGGKRKRQFGGGVPTTSRFRPLPSAGWIHTRRFHSSDDGACG